MSPIKNIEESYERSIMHRLESHVRILQWRKSPMHEIIIQSPDLV